MDIIGSPLEAVLDPTHRGRALDLLREYFAPGAFTGAHFERLTGGGDRPEVKNVFTAEDLVAVSMLSANVPAWAAVEILEINGPALTAALEAVPVDVAFHELSADDIGPRWAVRRLATELMEIPEIGIEQATKLMARKRPHLVPILDNVIIRTLSIRNEIFWGPLHAWLTADDCANAHYLDGLREEAEIGSDISVLRVFDVLAWRAGRGDIWPWRR